MSQTAPDYVQQHDILERRLFRLATTSDEDIESHVNRFFPLSLYLSLSLSLSSLYIHVGIVIFSESSYIFILLFGIYNISVCLTVYWSGF